MQEIIVTAGWIGLGVVLGGASLLAGGSLVHRLAAALTPSIDEEKEIIRGNRAVADYYGRVVGAAILGLSVIIAASILAAVHG